MTTIACRDGEMWADSLITSGTTIVGSMDKIFVKEFSTSLEEKAYLIIGFAGAVQDLDLLAEAILDGEDYTGEFECIVYDSSTKELYTLYDSTRKQLFSAPFYAIGSGADIALGAMAAGCSAKDAVEIASEYDTLTGGVLNGTQLQRK